MREIDEKWRAQALEAVYLRILAQLLTSGMTLGKLYKLSVTQFSNLNNRDDNITPQRLFR